MAHRYIKIGITALVLVSAFAFLMWTTLRDGTEYFKHVDEVVADRQAWEGKPLQLHGFVVPGSICVKPNTLDYPVQGAEQPDSRGRTRPRHERDVHGHRARHVQGRSRSGAEGQADARTGFTPTRTA